MNKYLVIVASFLAFSLQAYKITVVNRTDEPIYFKHSNALVESFLSRNPCNKWVMLPKDDPIKPNTSYSDNLTGLCIGVCFNELEIYDLHKKLVLEKSWKPGGLCKNVTFYVQKNSNYDWEILSNDPGEVISKYEPYVDQEQPGSSPVISEDLQKALDFGGSKASDDYHEFHELSSTGYGLLFGNEEYILKYFKLHPQDINAVDTNNNTPLLLVLLNLPDAIERLSWNNFNEKDLFESENKIDSMKSKYGEGKERVINTLNHVIEELLKTYKANPNIVNKDGITPLIAAIQNQDFKAVQMLLYAGASTKLQEDKLKRILANVQDKNIFNFVTKWMDKHK